MNINKNDLRYIWYEDVDGNIIKELSDTDCIITKEDIAKYGDITYHTCFPLEITEHVSSCVIEDGKVKFKPLADFNTHIGGGNSKLIVNMAASGDYTLNEALLLYANCCERCTNVLAYKYTNGEEGYAEFSDEWEKCGTSCKFCKDLERRK